MMGKINQLLEFVRQNPKKSEGCLLAHNPETQPEEDS
jgi:hypothetical protein